MGQGFRSGLSMACAVTALTFPATAAGGGGCANRNASSNSAPVAQMRSALVCLVNQRRAQLGLPALTVSGKLNAAAQRWTNTMIARKQFSHAHFVARIDAVRYDWRVAEENIATGYLTPSQTVAAWMASPDHCRNILDPAVRNVGTGEAPAPVHGWASGPSTWTQDFGLEMRQLAPSKNYGPQHGCPYH